MPRIPADAFERYISLGPAKTYQALADKLGCSKRSVTRRAVAENWQQRMAEIEAKARHHTDEKAAESLRAINTRHLKTLRIVQAKALGALANAPMKSGPQALAVLVAAIRAERGVLGRSAENNGVGLEELLTQSWRDDLGNEADGDD